MAVVTVKSGAITNRDASPKVLSNPVLQGGRVKECSGTVEVTTGNDIASIYVLASVPSNARVSQVLVYSDDMGTATAADIGLYRTTADGGAVVDADFFASALSLNGGALNGSDVTHESGVYGVEDREKTLWEGLGLSADPQIMYDICATLTAAADVGGTLSVAVKYV
jgi:hypothetical protein